MKKIVLYHGTDERLVKMSKAEREAYFKAVDAAMGYTFEAFKKLHFCEYDSIDGIRKQVKALNKEMKDEELILIYSALCVTGGWLADNPFLNYRELSATNSRGRACEYAFLSFAGGKLAGMTFLLIKTAEFLELPGYDPKGEALEAIQKVKDFADEKKAVPVLVKFEIDDPSSLEYEGGGDVDRSQFESWREDSSPFDVVVRKDISEGEREYLQKENENNSNLNKEHKEMKNIQVLWVQRVGENYYNEDPERIIALGGVYEGQSWEMSLEAIGAAIANNVYSFYVKVFNEDLPLIPVVDENGRICDLKTPNDVGALKLLHLLPRKDEFYQS
ncbi:hypothetical protein J6U78_02390 [bacterium]|nr:hypothetical protein [bacterium]MBP5435137.1 hypothetical protein [bacterium]